MVVVDSNGYIGFDLTNFFQYRGSTYYYNYANEGNVYIFIPVATKAIADESSQAIEGAKDLTFDEDFTPDETDSEVHIKLNGG